MGNKILFAFVIIFIHGCDNNRAIPTDTVIIDKATQLDDGRGISWSIKHGRYKLDLTSINGGANVEWVGATCPGGNDITQYSLMCDMPTNGQLIIKNPTFLGLGSAINVSVKLTYLAQ